VFRINSTPMHAQFCSLLPSMNIMLPTLESPSILPKTQLHLSPSLMTLKTVTIIQNMKALVKHNNK
jgi:hypothetical protein